MTPQPSPLWQSSARGQGSRFNLTDVLKHFVLVFLSLHYWKRLMRDVQKVVWTGWSGYPLAVMTTRSPAVLIREVCRKSKWKFKMAFAIKRPTPPPLMAQISRHFFTPLFSFAIESYLYATDFTLGLSQKYHF